LVDEYDLQLYVERREVDLFLAPVKLALTIKKKEAINGEEGNIGD
jgi:hypothetical protein